VDDFDVDPTMPPLEVANYDSDSDDDSEDEYVPQSSVPSKLKQTARKKSAKSKRVRKFKISVNPKQAARKKYAKNKRARKKQKMKDLRIYGSMRGVPTPKCVRQPKQSSGNIDFVHQSLLEHVYPASIINLAKQTVSSINAGAHTSKIFEVLEVIAALAITLPALKTPAQIAAQIVLSLRALTTGSLCEQILAQEDVIKWCKDLFGFNIFEPQTSTFGNAKMSKGVEWLSKIPELRENWDSVRNAPVFEKISALISVAAAVGLCSVTNLKFSVHGIDLFRLSTAPKHATAIDLVGAVLDTVAFFIEGGYECFKQGSFKPFFFTDDDSRNLDEIYFPLIELHEHAMVFNLHDKKVKIKGETRTVSDLEYSSLLDEALELAEKLHKSAKGTWQQGYLEKRIDVLRKNRAAYQAKRIDGSMRYAPFTVYIWGKSGRGKSTIAQLAMADCLASSGIIPDFKNIATLKETDKYDSTLKGDTAGIFLDDLGNTKKEFLDKSPTERIVDINNNMITYANKADLHEKGKIEIRPRVFIITANVPLATLANTGSICPFSIVRRADFHLEVAVKPDYALPDGRLDSAKARRDFPGDNLCNDLWDINVYTPMEKSAGGDSSHLRHIDGVNECKTRSIHDVLRTLTTACKAHFDSQRDLVRKGQNLVQSRNYCPTCCLAAMYCECIKVEETVEGDDDDVDPSMPPLEVAKYDSDSDDDDDDDVDPSMPPLEVAKYDSDSDDDSDDEDDSQKCGWRVALAKQKASDAHCPVCYFPSAAGCDCSQAEENEDNNSNNFDDTDDDVDYLKALEQIRGNIPDTPESFRLTQLLFANWGEQDWEEHDEKQASLEETFDFLRRQFDSMGAGLSNFLGKLPTWCFTNRLISIIYMLINIRHFLLYEKRVRKVVGLSLTLMFAVCYFLNCIHSFLCGGVLLSSHALMYGALLAKWRNDRMNDLLARRDATMEIFRSIRESKTKMFISMCAIAGVIYKFTSVLRTAVALQQSALVPENVAEIEARDKEANPWATAVAATLHVNDRSATMTFEQVLSKIEANLCHGVFVENGFQQKCNILALGGNTFLMPLHVFENRKDMKALITRRDPRQLNSQFKAVVSANYMVPIKGKDLCLVNIASGGVFADIRHLFPQAITASGSGHFLYKEADGSMKSDPIRIAYTKDSKSGGPGYDYDLPYNTFTGLCMGVVVAKFAKTCIAGLHLRGISNTPKGKALTITKDEIDEAWDIATNTWVGAFPSNVNGEFPVTRYDRQVLVTQDIHPNSPINYLPLGSNVEYLGQNGRRVTHTKSKVRKTPISDAVAEVTGVKNEFGPPKFHRTRMWQASLAHSANPSPGVEGSLVELAYRDYVDDIVKTLKLDKFKTWVLSELRPMTDMQTLCGKDGYRFIDAMPKQTSKGEPLSGPKREWIIFLDPADHPEFQCPAEAHPAIMKEMRAMEVTLLNGDRCYFLFKACVKDEVTLLIKDKVRVFQAADWAGQMLIRKYFLPIARMLSLFPLDSECAVGVNAQGPEWDELANHMKKHGVDRILAGDYSKYDLRMPAQLINAAFAVMIEIAEKCGNYSADDLTIMRGIATEIAYSCVAYNGDVIIHKGSNPSGHNLTVYINCIVNSLLLRCAYFHLWPQQSGKPLPFREVVAVMTYGDDVKGSVKEGYDWYNHISYANFLKERDMVFTMPDKESEPTPYMNDLTADFLKRENIFNPDTGMIHGALAEESIFKSLHAVLESKVVSLEDQSAGNIDGALREWWQHGRDVYELRRKQMKEVAFKCNLTGSCKMLAESYEDRLKHFQIRYLGREPDDDGEVVDEEAFVSIVGIEWDIDNSQTDVSGRQ